MWTPQPYSLAGLNKTNLKSEYIDFVENEVIEKGDKILVRYYKNKIKLLISKRLQFSYQDTFKFRQKFQISEHGLGRLPRENSIRFVSLR